MQRSRKKLLLFAFVCCCRLLLVRAFCNEYLDPYECQLFGSDTTECCLWCMTADLPLEQGKCVNGFISSVDNSNVICGGNSSAHCTGGLLGTCLPIVNCPGRTPKINGSWYFAPECGTFGGRLEVVRDGLIQFASKDEQLRRFKLLNYGGVVDSSGQLLLTNPNDGTQCYGIASELELAITCPSIPGWGTCVQHFYRSSAQSRLSLSVAILFIVLLFVAKGG